MTSSKPRFFKPRPVGADIIRPERPIAIQRQNRPVTLSAAEGSADCGMVSLIAGAGCRRKTTAIGKIPRRFAALNDTFFLAAGTQSVHLDRQDPSTRLRSLRMTAWGSLGAAHDFGALHKKQPRTAGAVRGFA